MARHAPLFLLALGLAFGGALRAEASPGIYLSTDEFLQSVFPKAQPEPARLVIDSALRADIEAILGHPFSRLRLHYWRLEGTSAWVLEEIGKTEPITIGVAVADSRIASLRILSFRESRGWEVRYPFFTAQFEGATLDAGFDLDRPVDGITGATLSVQAVEKIARVALLLDRNVRNSHDPAAASGD